MSDESKTTPTPGTDDDQGTKGKMVPESDLLAIKAGKEGLERDIKELNEAHRTQLAEVDNKRIAAEARAEELTTTTTTLATRDEELKTAKEQLATAQTSGEAIQTKALGYRRDLIAAQFNVATDTMKDKSMEQLDSFEEALKAVGGKQGAGNYAVGGGGGGAPAPERPIDRAARIIQEAEEKRGYGARVKEKETT